MSDTQISSRLKQQMNEQGMNSVELARRAEVKTSFIYDILSGKSANPSPLKLVKLAEALEVSLDYLAGGELTKTSASNTEDTDCISIPRLAASVSAGGGAVITSEHDAEHYYFRRSWIKNKLNAKPADLRMLFVSGDSMEPTLHDNDIILVNTSHNFPSPAGIFILFDGYGLVAKRVEIVGGEQEPRLRILADNALYSPYERNADEVRIIGRVVWFAREL